MKRLSFSAFIVLALIIVDISISVSYAKGRTSNKITIYKVTKVSPSGNLKLRAWPSSTSRILRVLPHNAKDLTETGKKTIMVGSNRWQEVNWRNNKGWVNNRYLKKTGVLLHKKSANSSKGTARNTNSTKKNSIKAIIPSTTPNEMPETRGGDHYSSEMKVAYQNRSTQSSQQLNCSGQTPKPWNINLDMAAKRMNIHLNRNGSFSIPIKYHEWASPTKVRMNIGGNRGRNIVDVNLQKVNSCRNGRSGTNNTYKINATINRQFYTGCCSVQ